MKPKIYLESTIPGYLTSRPSRDLVVAGHQQITQEWWQRCKDSFDLYISQFVLDEISQGDPSTANLRLKAVKGIPLLEITEEVSDIAQIFISSGIIPRKALTDALHIAIAAVNEMDYLLTWNCAHIANATITRRMENICEQNDLTCPVVCTPEELYEVYHDE